MEIYQPAEDSYFLSEILKKKIKNSNKKFLDMGCGSCIQSKTLLSLGVPKQNILAVDINPEAIKKAKALGVNSKKSNLFENIKEKFDIIIFNPPYLPEDKFDSLPDTTGGKKGDEIIKKFLIQAKKHLTKSGKIFLLTSSHTPSTWKKTNLKIKKIATKNLFFEKLFIFEIQHNS